MSSASLTPLAPCKPFEPIAAVVPVEFLDHPKLRFGCRLDMITACVFHVVRSYTVS